MNIESRVKSKYRKLRNKGGFMDKLFSLFRRSAVERRSSVDMKMILKNAIKMSATNNGGLKISY